MDEKDQNTKRMRASSLRDHRRSDEGRRRPAALLRDVDADRAEPNLIRDREARDFAEDAIIGGAFITATLDPQVVLVDEPIGVGQEHDPDLECAESAFIAVHHDAGALSGLAAVTDTELPGDHEDVVFLLLVSKRLEQLLLLRRLAEPVGAELAVAIIVKVAIASLLELQEDDLDGLIVGGRNVLPARDEEHPLRTRRNLLRSSALVEGLEVEEARPQGSHLVDDGA